MPASALPSEEKVEQYSDTPQTRQDEKCGAHFVVAVCLYPMLQFCVLAW